MSVKTSSIHSELTLDERAKRMRTLIEKTGGKQSSLGSLKRLVPYLKKCRWPLALGLTAMLVVALMTIAFGQGIRLMIDGVPSDPAEAASYANLLLGVALIVIVIYFLNSFTRMYCMRLVSIRVTEGLRKDVFRNVIGLGASYIDGDSSGTIQTRLIADTTMLGNFLAKQIPTLVKSSLLLVASLAACFYVNAELATIVVIGLPVIVVPFLVLSRPLRKVAKHGQAALADTGRYAGESFRRIKAVHAFDRYGEEVEEFSGRAGTTAEYDRKVSKFQVLFNALVESLAFAFFAVLFWFASRDVFAGRVTTGELVSFGFYVQALVIAARNVVDVGAAFHIAAGIASRIVEYLDAVNHDKPKVRDPVSLPEPLTGRLEIEQVEFAYSSRPGVKVLDGVTLDVPAGTRIALVGPSGCGKSTLLELIMRVYEPSAGSISLDGVDLKHLETAELSRAIGYMPQEDFLVSANVRENIRYGRSSASQEDVERAARLAQAHDFIEKLPEGYETDLGEVGSRLSGGQRQRIALARALLSRPSVLLLDEPTSSLDQSSEREVEAALDDVAASGVTVLGVTHSIESARRADRIAVMENGVIVSEGLYEELLEECAVFRRMAMAEPPREIGLSGRHGLTGLAVN